MAKNTATPADAQVAKGTAAALADAQMAVKEIGEKISGLVGRRRQLLLAGETAKTIAKLDADLMEARAARQIEADRAELLDAQLKMQAAERRLGEQAKKVALVEADFALRDDATKRVADAIAQLSAAFKDLFLVTRRIRESYSWRNPDISAAALGEETLVQLVQAELYRHGNAPVTGGMALAQYPNLPGAKAPTIQLMGMPSAIEPLVEAMGKASALASELMKTGGTTGGPDQLARGASGRSQEALLQRMMELADGDVNDPANAAEYDSVVAELAAVQGAAA
jgi:hypothetical protein